MTEDNGRLKQMVARLAAMADNDRAFVIDSLGKDARAKLAPWLDGNEFNNAISPALQSLMLGVARGQAPQTMTAKAVIALRSVKQKSDLASQAPAPHKERPAGRILALMQKAIS